MSALRGPKNGAFWIEAYPFLSINAGGLFSTLATLKIQVIRSLGPVLLNWHQGREHKVQGTNLRSEKLISSNFSVF
jgi:hypothetical protein